MPAANATTITAATVQDRNRIKPPLEYMSMVDSSCLARSCQHEPAAVATLAPPSGA